MEIAVLLFFYSSRQECWESLVRIDSYRLLGPSEICVRPAVLSRRCGFAKVTSGLGTVRGHASRGLRIS
jgi:hypothetical protein